MAINKIKPLTFKHLKPADKEQLIPDGGGLFVRIRPLANGGGVSFRLAYRFEGKLKWADLKAKTLPDARDERDTLKALLKTGVDPKLEKTLEKERIRKQQLDEHEALTKLNTRVTVNDLFTRWHEIDLINRKDRAEIARMFNKDVLPVLGDLFVEDVRKGHIGSVIDNLKIRGVNHLARNLLKLMRQMFRFAVSRDVIEFDPTASLSVAKITTAPTERDRTLSDNEIRALARQLPGANLLKSTECAVWIALSTLCRIGELSKAKLSDIDFESNTWTIPEANSKNGKAHTIYLSSFALKQFKLLKSLAKSDTWIFTNRDGSSHVCEKSITKQVGGRQSENILSNRSKENQALVLAGGKWTPHDLRRTGATIMGDLGVAPDVIEKCLNHTEENKVKRIYQRQKLEVEQLNAWQVLGVQLDLLVNMDNSNVVLLHERN
ncbi:MAG: tyrosine-type recombinase/integrase [Methylobacter sp.]|nr:tyrosine-type recombinase/integrase [Methylobacter sp.]